MTRRLVLVYVGLALLILLPLLKLGYIQTFDMTWGPRPATVDGSANTWLLVHLLQYSGDVLSQMVVQKILLIKLFFWSGVGAHRLFAGSAGERQRSPAAYLAGLLYMVNPFVYSRLMAGQWLVLLGYSLLPWTVAALWRLMQQPGRRTALIALGWTVGVGLASLHAVGFIALAAVVLFAVAGRAGCLARAKWCAALIGGWLVVSSAWLVPFLLGHSGSGRLIDSFGGSQLGAFASSGTVFGSVPLSTLLLQGFWADPQGRYYLPSHLGWWWGIAVVLLAGLIVYGVIVALRRRDRFSLALAVLALIAWWLGMGVGSDWSAGTARFLAQHLPLYRGYREPQKWLMLLALAYSYFAAIGLAQVLVYAKSHWPRWQPSVFYSGLLLPLLITPLLLWGAGGQLVSAQYPAGWGQVARTLDADSSDYQVLVLPWHLYLPVSFAQRVVANPAPQFFKQPLVISDNPELAGVPPTQSTALYRQIDNTLLPQRQVRTDAGAQLAPYRVKYVLLLHEADWQNYAWLTRQHDIKLAQRTDSISLYRNTEVH